MKRITILLILLSVAFSLSAKTIHTIMFVDSNDSQIGNGVVVDARMFQNWANMIADALRADGYNQKVYYYNGNLCNKNNLINVVSTLNCADDIVLFLYSGHGGRSVNDVSKFPRMCLGAHSEDQFVSVEYLNSLLQQKNPRLSIIIADCCNSYYNGNIPMGRMVSKSNSSTMTGYPSAKIRDLFVNRRGNIVSSGASQGEYGWTNGNGGGIFTSSFIDSFNFNVERSGEQVSWQNIFNDTKDLTFELSQIAYLDRKITKTQTPVFDINVGESVRTKKKLTRLDFGNGYYLGGAVNGKREGIGAYIFNDGSRFEGEFSNDNIDGSGIYFWTSDHYFAGTWVNGHREGYGIEVHPDGSYVIEYFSNDVCLTQAPQPRNAQRLNVANGYYLGEMREGKPHGRGKFYWNDGSSFEGTWINGVINGSGLLKFANNQGVYVGNWKNGTRQACYGLQCLNNGYKLIGYWENEVYRAKSFIIYNQ